MSSPNVVSKCRLPILRGCPYDFVSSGATQAWDAIFSSDFVVNSDVVALSSFLPYYSIFSALISLVLLG